MIGTHINFYYYRHLITYCPADNCKADARHSLISILPPDQVVLAAPQYLHLVLTLVSKTWCVLSLVINLTNVKKTNADNAEYSNATDFVQCDANAVRQK
jgi:hypothetical protein